VVRELAGGGGEGDGGEGMKVRKIRLRVGEVAQLDENLFVRKTRGGRFEVFELVDKGRRKKAKKRK
jgi:hypothetical protein